VCRSSDPLRLSVPCPLVYLRARLIGAKRPVHELLKEARRSMIVCVFVNSEEQRCQLRLRTQIRRRCT